MRYETLILDPLRDMTGQVMSFIPTLLTGIGILVVGWVFARLIRKLLDRLFKAINFDHFAGEVGLARILRIGGIKHKPGDMLSCLVYSVFMVMVFIVTVKSFGLSIVTALLDSVLGYIPHVIAGAIVLIIGMLVAKFVAGIVYVTAKNTDMPIPDTLARLSKWAIVAYVAIIYLKEIGFVSLFAGTHYTIFIGGLVFALALAFGLAGKDIAAKYLGVLEKKSTH